VGEIVFARGNRRDMALERLGERCFFRRERRQRPNMGFAGHGGHVVHRAIPGGCDANDEKNCK